LENLEMKKTLVALAALAATSAFAQNSVTIFGVIDQAYNQVKASGATATSDEKVTTIGAGANSANGSGNLQGSRIGFQGTEDLGNGKRAGFHIEYGINLTGAGPSAAGTATDSIVGQGVGNLRQGFVTLSDAKMGTLIAGTVYAFHADASGTQAAAFAGTGTNNTYGAHNLLKYGATFGNPRANNALAYVSPTVNGFTLKAAQHFGEQIEGSSTTAAAGQKNNRASSFALDYVQGPLSGGLAQTNYKDAVLTTTTLVDVMGTTNDSSALDGSKGRNNITNTVAGVAYNFGFAKVGLHTAKYKQENVAQSTGGTTGYLVEAKHNAVSAGIPLSANAALNLGYTKGNVDKASAKEYNTSAYDVTAVYSLTKRTNVYAMYTSAKFEGATSSIASVKTSHTAVGVRHSF
jgi:predicted porin